MKNSLGDVINLKRGDVLYKKGEFSFTLYIVVEGEITLFNGDPQNMTPVTVVGPKGFVGEQSLFAKQNRGLTAIASKEAKVIPIKKADIDEVMSGCPSWVSDIMKILGERLLSTSQALYEHSIVDITDGQISQEDALFYRTAVENYEQGS